MKLEKPLYSILQYLSTLDDTLVYTGNGIILMKNKIGSDFVEVEVPNFFKEPVVIRSLSKFLRLFSFGKGKSETNESLQDWTVEREDDPYSRATVPVMYVTMPGRMIKLVQGNPMFIDRRQSDWNTRFDQINLTNTIKFQITHQTYKQIISDCSLLDLDSITICSENSSTIKIYLSKKDGKTTDEYSSYTIECEHEHSTARISFLLSSFSLIEATDHQFEFGTYVTPEGYESHLLKIKSFCDNNYVVKKLIIGYKGVK